jgi:hypothetical protein
LITSAVVVMVLRGRLGPWRGVSELGPPFAADNTPGEPHLER